MNAKILASVTIAVALAQAGSAQAGVVEIDQSGFISGTESVVDTFLVRSAGTLTGTFTDTAWPSSSKDPGISERSPIAAQQMGIRANSEAFDMGTDLATLLWFGQAAGSMRLGLYGYYCHYDPVPLPGSLLLLASGLAAMLFWTKRAGMKSA